MLLVIILNVIMSSVSSVQLILVRFIITEGYIIGRIVEIMRNGMILYRIIIMNARSVKRKRIVKDVRYQHRRRNSF